MLPDGRQYLSGLLHDLNNYLYGLEFMLRMAEGAGQEFPEDIRGLSTKWRPVVEAWRTKLTEVRQQTHHEQRVELDWDGLIIEVGSILEGTSVLKDEASKLTSPVELGEFDFVAELQRVATKLEEHRHLIETQKYKKGVKKGGRNRFR